MASPPRFVWADRRRRIVPEGFSASGFTLVELLVVIAVIALLLVLILPAISGVRDRAETVADTQKLRTIAQAIIAYGSDHNGNIPNQFEPIAGTSTGPGQPDRWNFFEAVDRYMQPQPTPFSAVSMYNYQSRANSPWLSRSAKPYPSWVPQSQYPNLVGPLAFSYNPNINNGTHWTGVMARVPNRSQIVLMGEMNDRDGGGMRPESPAVFANNVQTRYRVSHPGQTALYLFCDFHIEQLQGDRGYAYYSAHPGEPNIWRWW